MDLWCPVSRSLVALVVGRGWERVVWRLGGWRAEVRRVSWEAEVTEVNDGGFRGGKHFYLGFSGMDIGTQKFDALGCIYSRSFGPC